MEEDPVLDGTFEAGPNDAVVLTTTPSATVPSTTEPLDLLGDIPQELHLPNNWTFHPVPDLASFRHISTATKNERKATKVPAAIQVNGTYIGWDGQMGFPPHDGMGVTVVARRPAMQDSSYAVALTFPCGSSATSGSVYSSPNGGHATTYEIYVEFDSRTTVRSRALTLDEFSRLPTSFQEDHKAATKALRIVEIHIPADRHVHKYGLPLITADGEARCQTWVNRGAKIHGTVTLAELISAPTFELLMLPEQYSIQSLFERRMFHVEHLPLRRVVDNIDRHGGTLFDHVLANKDMAGKQEASLNFRSKEDAATRLSLMSYLGRYWSEKDIVTIAEETRPAFFVDEAVRDGPGLPNKFYIAVRWDDARTKWTEADLYKWEQLFEDRRSLEVTLHRRKITINKSKEVDNTAQESGDCTDQKFTAAIVREPVPDCLRNYEADGDLLLEVQDSRSFDVPQQRNPDKALLWAEEMQFYKTLPPIDQRIASDCSSRK